MLVKQFVILTLETTTTSAISRSTSASVTQPSGKSSSSATAPVVTSVGSQTKTSASTVSPNGGNIAKSTLTPQVVGGGQASTNPLSPKRTGSSQQTSGSGGTQNPIDGVTNNAPSTISTNPADGRGDPNNQSNSNTFFTQTFYRVRVKY